MSVRILRVLALSLVLAAGVGMISTSVRADENAKGDKKAHGGPVAFILKHADALKLTDEQKTKLEALAKEHADKPKGEKGNEKAAGEAVKAILTPEQMTTLKGLREKEGGKGKEKKPEAK